MNKIVFLTFFLVSSISFSQQITKKEFKSLIKKSIKDTRKNGSPFDYRFITANHDSIFYKNNKIKLYSSDWAKYKNDLCRTVEFRFYNNKTVNLIDCQNCKEPSSCYVTKSENIYNYKIDIIENKIFLKLSNKFGEMTFEINSKKLIKEDFREYYEIEILKT